MKHKLIYILIWGFFACNQHADKEKLAQGNWIIGTEQEKLKTIERQFRGFDIAMIETGYRYQELYWAGQDQNWEYANYQIDKIRIAIENGLVRRPKRVESASIFLDGILPEMKKAIKTEDSAVFNKAFNRLTANCNSCHSMENVSFFKVQIPTQRQSPIRK